ncbi:diguanylate cyclase domain-containing protein [Rhabdochromatium marinum]|uniref:diguanylate cyclase domain-containing protein n=1 Tax=Rhabdochromatium marinum TaxID=48729 RepID=UPI0019058538|nr:diguanylate cyclase [Rhabdochromatium marinum]
MAEQVAEANQDPDSHHWIWPEETPDESRSAMVLFDCDGFVLGWNREAWLMLDYSAAETVGRPLSQVLGLDEGDPAVVEGIADFLASRMTHRQAGLPRMIAAKHRNGRKIALQLALATVPGSQLIGLAVLKSRETRSLSRSPNSIDWTRKLFDATPALILVRNAAGEVRNINATGCQLIKLKRELILGSQWIDTFIPEGERAAERNLFHSLLLNEHHQPVERRGLLHTRTIDRAMLWRHNALRNDQGLICAVVTIGVELEVPYELPTPSPVERSLATLIQNSFVGMLVLDEQGQILFTNTAAQRQLNQSAEALQDAPFGIPAIDHRTELSILRRDGGIGTAEVNISHSEWNGQPAFLVSLYDVTEHKETAQHMQQLAMHDPLTNIPNRRALLHHLHVGIQNAANEHQRLALAFLDLDDFKSVNDQFSHAIGDQLLCACATRLKQALRGSDKVFRLGGDEFIVMIEGLLDPEDVKPVLKKIRATTQQPLYVAEQAFELRFSAGLALYPDDADYGDLLLQMADESMYLAKAHKEQSTFRCHGLTLEFLCDELDRAGP